VSIAVVTEDADGGATYGFHVSGTADWARSADLLPADLPDGARAVHAGSLALAIAPGADVLGAWFVRLRGRCPISPRLESLVAAADLVEVARTTWRASTPATNRSTPPGAGSTTLGPALDFACTAAALACTRPVTEPPSGDETVAALRGR